MTRPRKAVQKPAKTARAPRGKLVHAAFPRITVHPDRMGGMPCVRDLRVTVANVLRLLAAGRSEDEILAEYPYLERGDFRDVLGFAAWRAEMQEEFLLPTA